MCRVQGQSVVCQPLLSVHSLIRMPPGCTTTPCSLWELESESDSIKQSFFLSLGWGGSMFRNCTAWSTLHITIQSISLWRKLERLGKKLSPSPSLPPAGIEETQRKSWQYRLYTKKGLTPYFIYIAERILIPQLLCAVNGHSQILSRNHRAKSGSGPGTRPANL